jgi:formimidoylglutamate deiminase
MADVQQHSRGSRRAWLPDQIHTAHGFVSGYAIVCNPAGQIEAITAAKDIDCEFTRLSNRALLPGMVNAHSHAFQRVIRGRTEYRSARKDSFWTWREMMYSAANRLSPEDVFVASRMAFLEMALSGITTVGEFHYLHNDPAGRRYDDPHLLAKQVISAAEEVGIRIALLRVAYARSGFRTDPNPLQARFIEPDVARFISDTESLISAYKDSSEVWIGVAPHSVRAVPLESLKLIAEYASEVELPLHMHVAEQPAEIEACRQEYNKTPVELLSSEGILSKRFTAVHAVHVSEAEIAMLGRSGSTVCACPSTERNLGDGIVPADMFFETQVPISLGTDSHVQIDLLEDARELEYHLRLSKLERVVLPLVSENRDALAGRLFESATASGARSLGFDGGLLEIGHPADFFSVDLEDPSVAGATRDTLLSNIVFSSARTAVRDVVVGGTPIVRDGKHLKASKIISDFRTLQERLWKK